MGSRFSRRQLFLPQSRVLVRGSVTATLLRIPVIPITRSTVIPITTSTALSLCVPSRLRSTSTPLRRSVPRRQTRLLSLRSRPA